MGFRISSQLVTLALWSLSLTNLSYGAPTAQDPCTALLKYADESAVRVPAKDAYACLLSPPFNQTRSANVHEQIRRLANILSSQAFFNDPKGLPLIVDRVDLNGTFNATKKKIDGNTYQNDYQFNRDLTELFGGYHDGHTLYWPNCMGVFGQFQHDYPLVSIVPPGEDTPRIYLADPKSGEVGEEITEIAGDPALEHLLKLVKVLKGPFDASWIDADTRWNGLFVGRDALGIQMGNFAGRDMYPGPDFKMKTASGKTIEVKWYVPGPSTWASSDYWKELFQSTDSYVTGFCIAPPTTSSTTTETPEGTETEDVPTDVPEQTETEDEPTDEITDDNSDYDGTTDETTEYPDDGTDDTSDYAGTTDETESFIVEIDDDETSEYSTEEETTIEGASRASPRPHRTAKSHSASHKYPVHPNFGYLDYITKRSPLNRREDFDVDWRKELRARGDGNTVEDFSGLQVTDIPPVAYPAVTTRLNGTEQSLHFLKSHPDVAVWGFHSFASRESVQPNNVQFFYYWRSYMIENLKLLKKQGVKRLILDMSNNGGGSVVLGMETVRRFFPEAEPFYGVDYRRSPLVDEFLYLTNVTTGLNQLDGKPFKSFEDFLSPPVSKKGDYFTKIGRFNQLGDSQQEIPGVEFTFKGDPPFAKENVVILTDGQCGSTCAITVEALASIGIATVVTGGQPSASGNKAMQYIGGIKGYQVLEFTDLEVSPEDPLNNQVTPELEPYVVRPIEISFMARCNLRNSYTPDDHIIPQEFIFQPADAHVWYTKQMINDKTILWNDVVKLTWDDKGVNKLLKARGGSDKKQGKAGAHHKVGTHLKQPQAGYKGRRTRETLKTGVLADLKYLASGWLGGWGGKD